MLDSPIFIPPDLEFEALCTNETNIDRDLYGLGISLCWSISGRYPFNFGVEPTSPERVIIPIISNDKRPLSEPLKYLLKKSTKPDRIDRFKSANELLNHMEEVKNSGLTVE